MFEEKTSWLFLVHHILPNDFFFFILSDKKLILDYTFHNEFSGKLLPKWCNLVASVCSIILGNYNYRNPRMEIIKKSNKRRITAGQQLR